VSSIAFTGLIAVLMSVSMAQPEDEGREILLIAGPPSHGYGSHEHYAGCVLLAKSLEAAMPGYSTDVIRHKWPENADAFNGVDAIVIYSDGGTSHPAIGHFDEVNELAARGIGIVCIHYAVEMPPGKEGDTLRSWIGGYFETHWSVNPHWTADFTALPDHPVSRGVQPFKSHDEWYFHMRFVPEMKGVTPVLSAVAPDSTMQRADGPHSGNPHVRQAVANGEPQHVAWAYERPDGGRGFGFTGGHFHWNWADRNFRRLMLNAIVWAARGEVPGNGVDVQALDLAAMEANQDFPKPADFDPEKILESQPDLKK
jgi:type 1 glutamine amidotransferase